MPEFDSKHEDQWFLKNEKKLLDAARAAREKREKERAALETAEARRKLKEAHWMKCPKCGHDMKTEDVGGVELDRCTFCEGLYVDAGELEQLYAKKEAERRGLMRRLLGI